jgi:hypothetical protein
MHASVMLCLSRRILQAVAVCAVDHRRVAQALRRQQRFRRDSLTAMKRAIS